MRASLGGMLLLLLIGQPVFAAQPSSRAMDQLATDKGCYLCHRAKPGRTGSNTLLPYAPSWVDIAKKYKGRKDAEDQLTEIVVGGSDPKDRHWRGKVSDVEMLPNIKELDENQARELVRWILSFTGS